LMKFLSHSGFWALGLLLLSHSLELYLNFTNTNTLAFK
jgi:hypothetical protein